MVVLQQSGGNGAASSTAFQVTYAPLGNGTDVRVIVTGYDFDYNRSGEPITRRIMQDFRIVKRVDAAVVSPSRIMIGKNVLVEGDLGAVFEEVDAQYGDPLVVRSDFYGLDATLDADLDKLFDGIRTSDVDSDNRLRVGHPTEAQGIPDLDGNGSPDGAALDVTQDGMVDEFDLFVRRYDANGDGMVALSNALRAGTPNASLTAEFVSGALPVDDDLALLIDSAMPDRNRNRVSSYDDIDADGKFDPAVDVLHDIEVVSAGQLPAALQPYVRNAPAPDHVWSDQVLGFRDGVIDRRDLYAKISGRLRFRVGSAEWQAQQGAYMDRINGPLNPGPDGSAMEFEVSQGELPEITATSFNAAENSLKLAADGAAFNEQAASNLGVGVAALATWTPAQNPAGPNAPKYYPLYPDANQDGLPDNWDTAYFKGFDLCLEVMARLNAELRARRDAGGETTTVVFFVVTQRPVRSLNPLVLEKRGVLQELRGVCREIADGLLDQLYRLGAAGERIHLDDLVDEYWRLRYKRTQFALRTTRLPLVNTHIIDDDGADPVLNHSWHLGGRTGLMGWNVLPAAAATPRPLWGLAGASPG